MRLPHCPAPAGLSVECLEDRSVPATHTYTNAGVTFNWSETANWDAAGKPTTGEAGVIIVVFPLAGTPSNQDIAGLVIDRINFTNTGNVVTLVDPLGLNGATPHPTPEHRRRQQHHHRRHH